MRQAGERLFWLGDDEGPVAHFDGRIRRCDVVSRVELATGRHAWRVHVDPPLPVPREGGTVDDVVLAERYVGESLEHLDGNWVTVNVCRLAREPVRGDERRRDGDLTILYVGQVAGSRNDLPTPVPMQEQWHAELARIRRFVEHHGHSRVPEDYEAGEGPLYTLVTNLRWHHAGKAGASPGPFPGVDYASDLDRLPGWDWDSGWEASRSETS